jgi:hypothetical protein
MKINVLAIFLIFSLAAFSESSFSKTVPASLTSTDSLKMGNSGLSTDSVDIGQMVNVQIDNARIKQTQDSIHNLEAKDIILKTAVSSPAVISIKPKKEISQWESLVNFVEPVIREVSMANEITIKLSIMGTASSLAFIIVFVRRKKLGIRREAKSNFKDGIKLIREERVRDRKNSGLSLIRNKLIGRTSSFLLSNDSVVKNARELNIAKGEIYLAARIKSHELKKISS